MGGADTQPACPLDAVLKPHITLLARTPISTVHTRILSALFTPLLNALAVASDTERPAKRTRTEDPVYAHILMGSCIGEQGSEERASRKALRRGVLQALFRAAADPGANETDRRKIYKVWREEGGDDDEDDED
jgi:ribosomal RNA-processing protein 1